MFLFRRKLLIMPTLKNVYILQTNINCLHVIITRIWENVYLCFMNNYFRKTVSPSKIVNFKL